MEKENYENSKGFKCPHCGGNNDINVSDEKIAQYETDANKKWMEEHTGYQWTEDLKCSGCGKMYSMTNGC